MVFCNGTTIFLTENYFSYWVLHSFLQCTRKFGLEIRQETMTFWRCCSLNFSALAVPRQPKNSGVATESWVHERRPLSPGAARHWVMGPRTSTSLPRWTIIAQSHYFQTRFAIKIKLIIQASRPFVHWIRPYTHTFSIIQYTMWVVDAVCIFKYSLEVLFFDVESSATVKKLFLSLVAGECRHCIL